MESNTHPIVSATSEQISTQKHITPKTSMLDELTTCVESLKSQLKMLSDEAIALSRKIREFAIVQRQKEREYRQRKQSVNSPHMADAA